MSKWKIGYLFATLSPDRILRVFAGFDMSSDEIPAIRIPVPSWVPVSQQQPAAAD